MALRSSEPDALELAQGHFGLEQAVQRSRQLLRKRALVAGVAGAVPLPGLDPPEPSASRDKPLLPPQTAEAAHPLVTTLRDLDANHLTPMQALALITEWKTLWGGD